MRWARILSLLLVAGLMSGCDVVRGGVFIATVSHYHGGEARSVNESSAPRQLERAPEIVPDRVPPRVPPNPVE